MRHFAPSLLLVLAACPGKTPVDDSPPVDAATSTDGSSSVDAAVSVGCPLASPLGDLGMLAALKAQRCNVPNSGGTAKWYRLSALVPNTMDYVQLELWPGMGAYAGVAVTTGTQTIMGQDAGYNNCGVCGRALGDKMQASQK